MHCQEVLTVVYLPLNPGLQGRDRYGKHQRLHEMCFRYQLSY